jgi:hypothetical protein
MMHDGVQGNLIFNTVLNSPALVKTAQVAANKTETARCLRFTASALVCSTKSAATRRSIWPTSARKSRHLVNVRNINAIPHLYAFSAAAQDPANYAGGVVPSVEPNLPAIYADAGFNYSGAYACGIPLLPTLRSCRTKDMGRLRIWVGAARRTTTRCKHRCSADSQRV